MKFRCIPKVYREHWVREYNEDFDGKDKIFSHSLRDDEEHALAVWYIKELHSKIKELEERLKDANE